jgi:4-diphosphocytidyl-2-C-methyl-D-erythritol kinase
MVFTFRSPAKINLFLRILRRREDGYHDLASLFQGISFYDWVHFASSDRDTLTCDDPQLSCGSDNFITRALSIFKKHTGIRDCFEIRLEKNIPPQAGLGGGSSNCATTLFALNQLCKTGVPESTLSEWARQISTDAAFFFSTGTAYFQGVGERIESLSPMQWLLQQKIYVIKPLEGLSTKEIYHQLVLQECSSQDPRELLEGFVQQRPCFHNDLEVVAYRICPSLQKLREKFCTKFSHFFMTGSGTAHIGFSEKEHPDLSLPVYSTVNRVIGDWY